MEDLRHATQSASQEVLSIEKGGAMAFIQQQLHDRLLHETVVKLNQEYLFGTPNEREDARKALTRLGFAEV
ncbi:hypothetical protein SLH49_02410 [Cognatiyoonia sp. IB215446]|uniref:hypothetical protein n=1 Tax=Cognatiyoonia sp. IB215446 TaxID=3097355 RepID=UPI002A151289|nr:hypothetical protein [Cognatiyoonia sp. IB215446]MDX8346828.1 hypothetical protein [Cognatiyoonia sp. IB215446]